MSEAPKEELGSCPFCGSKAIVQADPDGEHWVIRCTKCPAMMQGRREDEPRFMHLDQREALIREWSRRE